MAEERKEPPAHITLYDLSGRQSTWVHAVRTSAPNNGDTCYEIHGHEKTYSYEQIKSLALMGHIYRVLEGEFRGQAKFMELTERCAQKLEIEEIEAAIAADDLIIHGHAEWIPGAIRIKPKA